MCIRGRERVASLFLSFQPFAGRWLQVLELF